MHVRKTFEHRGVTLAHGPFRVRETEHVCACGCTGQFADDGHPQGDGGRGGHPLVRRQATVAQLLLPRSTMGYDLMAYVGLQRFVHYRQREEIRASLASRWGIEISTGEVSVLAAKFCVYLKALHQAHAASLREVLASDGGWPMHIDATGEDGRGTLLVIYAGWRHWVLGSWKISTERMEAILPRMTETAVLFGAPCAVMRDLGRAVIEASQTFIASLDKPIPDLGCHMHFVRDVGKDLLADSHDALRSLFRRFEIVAGLRSLARDLGRRIGPGLVDAREQVASWLEKDAHPYILPDGHAGLAAVRALTQWTLDWTADGQDEGFPFDRPWYDLYKRCMKTCRATEAFLSRPHDETWAYHALKRLFRIVSTVRSEVPFGRQAAILASRAQLLDELRDALRLKIKERGRNPGSGGDRTPPAEVRSPETAAAQLQDIETAIETLTSSLRERRPGRGPACDTREAIDLVLDHLARHGPSLFGHLMALPDSLGGGVRVVERTNVVLESFFHRIKHGERRRSGRKTLTQDFEHLPPEAALAINLTCPDYVRIVCNSLDELPAAFARLDAGHRDLSLPARTRAAASPAESVTSSMTTVDRKFVRTEALVSRVQAATRSRSVRRCSWREASVVLCRT